MTDTEIQFAPLDWQTEEISALRPRRKRPMVVWAETRRKLTRKTTATPGPWRWDYCPFMIEPACWFDDYTVYQITIEGCTQFGKSEFTNNIIGTTVEQNPASTMLCMPRENDVKVRIQTHIKTMFENCPQLMAALGGDLDKINVGEPTDFGTMLLYLAWSTSSATLSDRAIAIMIFDEPGEYLPLPGMQTDQISLGRNRQRTFTFPKMVVISSAKLADSLSHREFLAGDRCEDWICCPHCGEFHIPVWKNFVLDKDKNKKLLAPERYKKDPDTSRYVCPRCGTVLTRGERWAGVRGGVWCPANCRVEPQRPKGERARAAMGAMNLLEHIRDGGKYNDIPNDKADAWVVGEEINAGHKSARVSAFLLNPRIPNTSAASLAAEWSGAQEAKRSGDIRPLMNVINNQFGDIWEDIQTKTDETQFAQHIGDYPEMVVPEDVFLLTAGFDIQQDHIFAQIMGWGYLYESWLIYAARLETGDTRRSENWGPVTELLGRPWPLRVDDQKMMLPRWTLIDSQFNTDAVYTFCRSAGRPTIAPARGEDNVQAKDFYRVKKVDRQVQGRKAYKGLLRYEHSPLAYKDRVAYMMTNPSPGGGYIHLHQKVSDAFIKQVCAEEKKTTHDNKGRPVSRWVLKPGRYDNHFFDTTVLNLLAADLAGVGRIPNPDAPRRKAQKTKPKSNAWEPRRVQV